MNLSASNLYSSPLKPKLRFFFLFGNFLLMCNQLKLSAMEKQAPDTLSQSKLLQTMTLYLTHNLNMMLE